jgi:hypothetical protein
MISLVLSARPRPRRRFTASNCRQHQHLSCIGYVRSRCHCTEAFQYANYSVSNLLAMPKPTEDWERVGDRFYRKTQLYTSIFEDSLEIENYVVTGAPYSGAVGTPSIATFVNSRF